MCLGSWTLPEIFVIGCRSLLVFEQVSDGDTAACAALEQPHLCDRADVLDRLGRWLRLCGNNGGIGECCSPRVFHAGFSGDKCTVNTDKVQLQGGVERKHTWSYLGGGWHLCLPHVQTWQTHLRTWGGGECVTREVGLLFVLGQRARLSSRECRGGTHHATRDAIYFPEGYGSDSAFADSSGLWHVFGELRKLTLYR